MAQLSPVLAARLQVVAFAGDFLSLCEISATAAATAGGRGLSSGEVKKSSLPQPLQKTENTKLTKNTTGGAPTWQGDFLLCLPVSR